MAAQLQRRTTKANARCSRTVSREKRLPSWGTYPTPRAAGRSAVTSRPNRRMEPAVTARRPHTASTSVVLPVPVLPISTPYWPVGISSDTRSSENMPWRRVTCESEIMVS